MNCYYRQTWAVWIGIVLLVCSRAGARAAKADRFGAFTASEIADRTANLCSELLEARGTVMLCPTPLTAYSPLRGVQWVWQVDICDSSSRHLGIAHWDALTGALESLSLSNLEEGMVRAGGTAGGGAMRAARLLFQHTFARSGSPAQYRVRLESQVANRLVYSMRDRPGDTRIVIDSRLRTVYLSFHRL